MYFTYIKILRNTQQLSRVIWKTEKKTRIYGKLATERDYCTPIFFDRKYQLIESEYLDNISIFPKQ